MRERDSAMSEKKQKAQVIVALDVNTLEEVRSLVVQLDDYIDCFKVGSQLFTSCGPAAVRFIEARGKRVFLDLKFHDIPHTVARAVEAAAHLNVAIERSMSAYKKEPPRHKGLFMYTLHTSGGPEMLKAAVEAGTKAALEIDVPKPLAIGVTVLTSEQKTDSILTQVLQKAECARKAGCDGVVASCHEAPVIRREFGPDFIIVTPGIRPAGGDVQDQKRTATPQEAIKSGSSFLVIGRPIIRAADPRQAAKQILQDIQAV